MATLAAAPATAQKRVLVTGGAGFLGSHLCERLLKEGHKVICFDNLFTGDERNIAHLKGPNFEFVKGDVCDPEAINKIAPCDQIYSLACPASPPHYQYDPIKTLETSVLGMMNLLKYAEKHKARILQASTSEVYGDPDAAHHPQQETYWGNVNCIGVRSCYDEGKRVAETLMFDYYRTRGVEIRVVRIFNTYGPRMHPYDGRVVTNFVIQALQGKPITLYGDGSQTRSFCFVSDLIEGFIRMMACERFTGPVNLGNPGEFTMKQLAEKVLALTGSSSPLVTLPLPGDDPRQRKPDITLAGAKLGGWAPTVDLDEGLRQTIAHFRGVDLSTYNPSTAQTAHEATARAKELDLTK